MITTRCLCWRYRGHKPLQTYSQGYDWSSVKTYEGGKWGTIYASAHVRMPNSTYISTDYILRGNYTGLIDMVKILPSDSIMRPAGQGMVTIEMNESYLRSDRSIIESSMHANILFLAVDAILPFEEIIHIEPLEYSWSPGNLTFYLHTRATVRPATIAVGGFTMPVSKSALLAPYIGLASTTALVTAATAIYTRRIKRGKEKQ